MMAQQLAPFTLNPLALLLIGVSLILIGIALVGFTRR